MTTDSRMRRVIARSLSRNIVTEAGGSASIDGDGVEVGAG